MKTINRPGSAETVLKKWLGRLEDSHALCPYCCKRKKDYICPDTGVLTPLICECEKQFKNLEETRTRLMDVQKKIIDSYDGNVNKFSADEKRYMIDADTMIDVLNESIGKMRKLGYDNQRGGL